MIERIRGIITSKNLNAAQFADQIGVQRSSISHILSGRNKPSLEFIQKVLKAFPDINSDWLLNGSGEISNTEKSVESVSNLFAKDELKLEAEPQIGKMRPEIIDKAVSTVETEKKNPPNIEHDIERVIIFYKNGKFKEYTQY